LGPSKTLSILVKQIAPDHKDIKPSGKSSSGQDSNELSDFLVDNLVYIMLCLE